MMSMDDKCMQCGCCQMRNDPVHLFPITELVGRVTLRTCPGGCDRVVGPHPGAAAGAAPVNTRPDAQGRWLRTTPVVAQELRAAGAPAASLLAFCLSKGSSGRSTTRRLSALARAVKWAPRGRPRPEEAHALLLRWLDLLGEVWLVVLLADTSTFGDIAHYGPLQRETRLVAVSGCRYVKDSLAPFDVSWYPGSFLADEDLLGGAIGVDDVLMLYQSLLEPDGRE